MLYAICMWATCKPQIYFSHHSKFCKKTIFSSFGISDCLSDLQETRIVKEFGLDLYYVGAAALIYRQLKIMSDIPLHSVQNKEKQDWKY